MVPHDVGEVMALYPSSYFSGPLGSRTPVPLRSGGGLLIDMYGGIGLTPAGWRAGILQREASIGRRFDGLQIHYGAGTYRGLRGCLAPDRARQRKEKWIHAHGALPLVVWSPNRTIGEVNAGRADDCFKRAAQHFRSFDFVIMLRLFHEFDVTHVPWHGCGQAFAKAWRRVVGIFRDVGATNVGFWWVPTESADRGCLRASYPGDRFVDWVGSDTFNFCYSDELECYSTPLHSGWAEFAELADHGAFPSVHDLYGPRKPFVIGETGTVFDPAKGGGPKGDWFRRIPAAARTMRYLRGVSFYDADVSAVEGPRNNFMVDYPTSDPAVYAGFVEMARDRWFTAGSR
jgi:hypothetical protein